MKNKEESFSALIYVRVSSDKQRDQGTGLESQEHRCRQFAIERGYDVEAVYSDEISGGGDPRNRPGMQTLLAHLKRNKRRRFVVIFDDLKRFARDTEGHLALRKMIAGYNATVASPNYTFDGSPEGEFAETIFAAQGELERKQNRRQVIQKMTARLERGYWTFMQPVGYKYKRDRQHGKILVRDEPAASIIEEALTGFANGRFALQTEVARFLQSHPEFPLTKADRINQQSVSDLLRRVIYAGMIERPEWGITRRPGHHEAIISWETYCKIVERLDGRPHVPERVDRNEAFPLRGFVDCAECNSPLTGSFSKSRNGVRHAYYFCFNKACSQKAKSIRRDKLEGEFETLVKSLEAEPVVFDIFTSMFKDAWEQRSSQVHARARALEVEAKNVANAIDQMLTRVTEVTSSTVMAAFEKRIEKLENEKLILEEKIEQIKKPRVSFDESLRTALLFLKNPWKLWSFGAYEHKRTLLQLAFSSRLSWSRNGGLRTANLALPFRALAGISCGKKAMVDGAGFEPAYARAGRFTVCCH